MHTSCGSGGFSCFYAVIRQNLLSIRSQSVVGKDVAGLSLNIKKCMSVEPAEYSCQQLYNDSWDGALNLTIKGFFICR